MDSCDARLDNDMKRGEAKKERNMHGLVKRCNGCKYLLSRYLSTIEGVGGGNRRDKKFTGHFYRALLPETPPVGHRQTTCSCTRRCTCAGLPLLYMPAEGHARCCSQWAFTTHYKNKSLSDKLTSCSARHHSGVLVPRFHHFHHCTHAARPSISCLAEKPCSLTQAQAPVGQAGNSIPDQTGGTMSPKTVSSGSSNCSHVLLKF